MGNCGATGDVATGGLKDVGEVEKANEAKEAKEAQEKAVAAAAEALAAAVAAVKAAKTPEDWAAAQQKAVLAKRKAEDVEDVAKVGARDASKEFAADGTNNELGAKAETTQKQLNAAKAEVAKANAEVKATEAALEAPAAAAAKPAVAKPNAAKPAVAKPNAAVETKAAKAAELNKLLKDVGLWQDALPRGRQGVEAVNPNVAKIAEKLYEEWNRAEAEPEQKGAKEAQDFAKEAQKKKMEAMKKAGWDAAKEELILEFSMRPDGKKIVKPLMDEAVEKVVAKAEGAKAEAEKQSGPKSGWTATANGERGSRRPALVDDPADKKDWWKQKFAEVWRSTINEGIAPNQVEANGGGGGRRRTKRKKSRKKRRTRKFKRRRRRATRRKFRKI